MGTRLTLLLVCAGLLCAGILALALRDYGRLNDELAWVNEAGKVRRAAFALLHESAVLRAATGEERSRAERDMRARAAELDRAIDTLRRAEVSDPRVAAYVGALHRRSAQLAPMLEAVARGGGPSSRGALDRHLREQAADANAAVEQALRADAARARRSSVLGATLLALTLALLVAAIALGRRVAARARELARVSGRIAGGDLLARAPQEGGDELALLGRSFNAMTSALRDRIGAERAARTRLDDVLREIERVSAEVAHTSGRIVEATVRQSVGAGQQATSVAETARGADRLTRAAADATTRAHEVLLGARRSEATGRAGAEAANAAAESMREVRARMAGIRDVVSMLSQRGRALAEVVATVDGIAAQTQLVALNATIEAARGGPESRSFSVVAMEVKALAERTRAATVRVREILGEMERSVESAVAAAEAGQGAADGAVEVVERARRTIDELCETITRAAALAAGIEETVDSQAGGIAEIRGAVRAIDEAMGQSVAATREAEAAARALDALAVRLRDLVTAR